MEPLKQRLELESGGRITADIFLGGELTPMGEEVTGLEAGIFDFSALFLANYKADLFPLAPVKSLPLVGTRALHVNEAYKKLLYDDAPIKDGKSFYDIMYADRAVPLKAWISMSYDGYLISTTGKRIEKPEDLKGLTLRGSGLTWLIFLDKMGATPVHLSAMDMYDAMQRGTIEGSLYSIGDWHGYGFGELFRYVITGMNSGHWADTCGMTQARFDKLPEDIQEMFDRILKDLANPMAYEMMRLQDWQIGESIAVYGCEFVDASTLDQALQDALAMAQTATWAEWIDIVEAEGYPAKAACKLYSGYILEAGGFLPAGVPELLE